MHEYDVMLHEHDVMRPDAAYIYDEHKEHPPHDDTRDSRPSKVPPAMRDRPCKSYLVPCVKSRRHAERITSGRDVN
jgi:hypothetical protein